MSIIQKRQVPKMGVTYVGLPRFMEGWLKAFTAPNNPTNESNYKRINHQSFP
jgi:hypothetical protein